MSANPSKPKESVERRNKNLLNNSEQEFVASRRKTVLQSLKKLKIQCSRKEVPNIALLGSGGAQRAMVGLLGSLVQLDKAGLLDCILYLSGVSGSTWCMASLYKEPNWSTKLETVKNKIIERISGPGVSWGDALTKLKKYYYGKDFFSLTDVWAVMVVASIVKEIDEHTLTEQRNQHNKDPFPIYAVIDKQSKQSNDGDPWFEINPYEAGYSLSGVFVDTGDFGSQFHKGSKIKHQDEFDMLYLQALCGSALGDEVAIKNDMWQKIKDFFQNETILEAMREDLSGGKSPLISSMKTEKQYIKRFAMDVCEDLSSRSNIWQFDAGISICKCMAEWIWGRKYNFLHNMTDEAVNSTLLQSETRDYIDAGVLLNSPYFSVLREDRDIDLIISLDFSEGDPFMTVRDSAETCKKLKIPFPEVKVPSDEGKKPKDFYVFKGQNSPTMIHIPLFNAVNCGGKFRSYSCPD
ncbi:cytosolic phospholipase A2 gamma-like [Carassius carassius]|uniref:cytosolic phospholipase A2 gamma-like n=1 Tax=Carassius carassius TaxID=217509 RepID=UPI0028696B93|nr:cytosolic phospholipase A2 gamma-like [Carassius carassius]